MQPVETIHRSGYRIDIYPDRDPESPREWDNLGTFLSWHRRYQLGDKDVSRCANVKEATADVHPGAVVLPVYLYDHSGLRLSTRSFTCPWDSGQVGVIYVNPDRIRAEYGVKRITKAIRDKVRKILEAELEVADHYVSGNVYGYTVTHEATDEQVGSCWGFYGYDHDKSGLMENATSDADHDRRERIAAHIGRLKAWIRARVDFGHRAPLTA